MNEVLFSLAEASRTMGVTPAKLERLIEEGTVPAVSDGVRRYVTRQAVLDYMALVNAARIRAGRADRTRGGGRQERAAPAAEAAEAETAAAEA